MKNITATLLLLLITIIGLTAQVHHEGIFSSWHDYKDNKLSLVCDCNSKSDKIRLNHFLSKDYVTVINGDKKYKLNKDSIFGYRDCQDNDYRFYKDHDREYRILESKSIVIYTADVAVTSQNGKARELVQKYFFSTAFSAPIFPLTVINLKKEFPDNFKFHDMLDITFSNGTIDSYDQENKMYKVNYLLSKSITN